jgi:hypothetical protein
LSCRSSTATKESATKPTQQASCEAGPDASSEVFFLNGSSDSSANGPSNQRTHGKSACASKTRAEQTQDEWECHQRTSY